MALLVQLCLSLANSWGISMEEFLMLFVVRAISVIPIIILVVYVADVVGSLFFIGSE